MGSALRDLLTQGSAMIAAGRDGGSAWLDASLLWALVSGQRRDAVLARLGEPLSADPASMERRERFLALCSRRAEGYPLAYLRGSKEFFGHDFVVDESVLIPRPETEILVEWVLETCPEPPAGLVADVCTGSGCIPISLGLAWSQTGRAPALAAADLSAAALRTAALNHRALAPRLDLVFHQGDLLDGFPASLDPLGLLTANPPYVPRAEALASAAVWREPAMALDGGPDGLDLIRRLAGQARTRLAPGAWFFLEYGDGQSEAISRILVENGFAQADIRTDLAGLPRVLRTRLTGA